MSFPTLPALRGCSRSDRTAGGGARLPLPMLRASCTARSQTFQAPTWSTAACTTLPLVVGTVEALLVSRATARLRSCGIVVEEPLPDADRELYRLLDVRDGSAAHSVYNALARRLVSFMRAAEQHAP